MKARRVVVVGAGMGGLAAAIDLARSGHEVTVIERQHYPGGKMRSVSVDGEPVDGGPTVFTMRWIFEGLLSDAGCDLSERLELHPAKTLARHAWHQGGQLDLFADRARSMEAIADFAGAAEARAFERFCLACADMHDTLLPSFMAAQRPSPLALVKRVGWHRLGAMWRTQPHRTMWSALGGYFKDPRLQQLFGRYATYCGSSPLQAPATLMLVAHVEQEGVWLVRDGMRAVAAMLHDVGMEQGAEYRFGSGVCEILTQGGRVSGVVLEDGEQLRADAVVFNGDVSALARGLLGPAVVSAVPHTARKHRSLSALTWCVRAQASGFSLKHHNVFFFEDYPSEFHAIFRRRTITQNPTIYLCAQDRGIGAAPQGRESMLILINAPADGDQPGEVEQLADALWDRALDQLQQFGLVLEPDAVRVRTSPQGFDTLFPGTGGALYGRANHGGLVSFRRPGASSRIPGLYLAGGSVHPGPGIPLSTMSGRLAAARLLADLT